MCCPRSQCMNRSLTVHVYFIQKAIWETGGVPGALLGGMWQNCPSLAPWSLMWPNDLLWPMTCDWDDVSLSGGNLKSEGAFPMFSFAFCLKIGSPPEKGCPGSCILEEGQHEAEFIGSRREKWPRVVFKPRRFGGWLTPQHTSRKPGLFCQIQGHWPVRPDDMNTPTRLLTVQMGGGVML